MAMKRARTAIVSGGLKPIADKPGGNHSRFANALLSVLKDNNEVLVGENLFQRLRGRLAVKAKQIPRYSTIRRAAHEGGDDHRVPLGRGAQVHAEQPRPDDLIDEADGAAEQEDGGQDRFGRRAQFRVTVRS